MSPISFSIKNPVLVNILMVAVLILGLVAFLSLPRELISEISFNWVFIIVPYFNATPSEIEDLVVNPIEEEIADLDGIDKILGYADSSGAFLFVKYETMGDDEFQRRLLDLKSEVDKVDMPEEAEDVIVEEFSTADFTPVIRVTLYGDIPKKQLKKYADDMSRDLTEIRNVGQVSMTGISEREVWIEVRPTALETNNIHMDQIINAVTLQNRNMPAGSVQMGRTEYSLQTVGKFRSLSDIENVVIKVGPNGEPVIVSDVAQVLDTFQETRTISRIENKPAITLSITKKANASSLDVIADVRALVADYRKSILPPSIETVISNDTGKSIRETLSVLQNNAAFGLALVVVILYLFIGGRNALFVAMGIPITFFTTFIFMHYMGSSLDGNSIFGLVLCLGIVVDDAIIIIENCYRHYQMGKTATQAALDGTREVAWPVVAATMTTVAAFLPLMLMPGTMGKFMRIIPLVVCLVLAASMVEAFVILPSHFAEWSRRGTKKERGARWLRFLRSKYTPILIACLRRRRLVIIGGLVLTIIAGITVSLIGMDLFAEEEINMFSVWVTMPEGTALEATDEAVLAVAAMANTLPAHELVVVQAMTGHLETDQEWIEESNVGMVAVELVSKKEGRRKIQDVIAELRGKCSSIPGVKSLEFYRMQGGPPTGKPIEIDIRGKNYAQLEEILGLLRAKLEETDGVIDIWDDYTSPKKELQVRLDPRRAAEFGLDNASFAGLFRAFYQGRIATTWWDAGEEVEVLVRFPEAIQKDVSKLRSLMIPVRTLTGEIRHIPLETIATIEEVEGTPKIRHIDRDRAINIKADIDKNVTDTRTPNMIIGDYWDSIRNRYPGYTLQFGGQFQEFQEAFSSLARLFLFGMILIYTILGGQFRSYIQPIIILFAIPFAFIGSVFGLLISGAPFSIIAMYGMVALAGIAVNDAIVMISFINDAREQGVGRWESIIRAGRLRLRPIILTTVTTVGGLLPTALGIGGHSNVWSPLANVIVWGMLVGTMMTLFVVPCIYTLLIDDVGIWRQARRDRKAAKRAAKKAAAAAV